MPGIYWVHEHSCEPQYWFFFSLLRLSCVKLSQSWPVLHWLLLVLLLSCVLRHMSWWKKFYMNDENEVSAHDWSLEYRSEIDCLWIVVNFVFVLLIKIGFMTQLCFYVARWRSTPEMRQLCHEIVGIKPIFNPSYLPFQLIQVVSFGESHLL